MSLPLPLSDPSGIVRAYCCPRCWDVFGYRDAQASNFWMANRCCRCWVCWRPCEFSGPCDTCFKIIRRYKWLADISSNEHTKRIKEIREESWRHSSFQTS